MANSVEANGKGAVRCASTPYNTYFEVFCPGKKCLVVSIFREHRRNVWRLKTRVIGVSENYCVFNQDIWPHSGFPLCGAGEEEHMKGIGVDILAIDRLRPLEGLWDDPFFRATFTEAERAYCLAQSQPLRSFAAAFAAKEAVFKALGLPGDGVRLAEIETGRTAAGQPTATLRGTLAARARERGITALHLSLSYETELVTAFAVAE